MVTAPAKDRIYGSNVNKPGSSSSSKTAESISLSDSTIKSIQNKVDEHNSSNPKKKVTLDVAKAVVRRGMGAYSSSHRPTITGGKPNSRVAWGLARLNAFLYKIKNGKSKSGKYSQDNDLIDELGYKHSKFEDGGTATSKLKAPNGKPSNLTPEQWKLVRTPQFKAWFGDWENDPENASKVVDENFEPLVVYHGTNNQFTKFKLNPRADSIKNNLYQTGLWFFAPSFDKSMNENERAYFYKKGNAEFMAETWMANKDEKGNLIENKVIKAFLNVRKPKIVNGLTDSQAEELVYHSEKMRQLKKNDAVIMHGCVTDGNVFRDDINVLEPTQIKLADGSNTTFDGNNPDIRFAEGGETNNINMNRLQQGDALMLKDSEGFDSVIYVDSVENTQYGDILTLSNGQTTYHKDLIKKYRQATESEVKRSNIMGFELFAKGGAVKEVKRGGITYGPSHAEGGIPVRNKSTNEMLEVEGGEGITNKHVMASSETVKLNGKEMTLCEAVSAINQMDGNGVKFNCDDVKHKQFIQEMANGGELERGTRTEEEHIQVLRDLYAKKITPEQATEKIAKDHLKEDKDYYKKLSRLEHERYKMPKGKICGCGCSLKSYDNGGMLDSFGLGSFEEMATSFSKSKLTLAEQKKELIDLTLTTGRDKVDTDYKADLMKNTPQEFHKYWENSSHVNLYKYGWRLQFTTSRTFAGLCSGEDFGKVQKGNLSKDRNLFISVNFVKSDANWENHYLDCILHECAHAIVREMIIMKIGYQSFLQLDPMHEITEGHGKIWEMVCQAINPNGSCGRFYENAILENTFYEYIFECQNCGNEGFGRTKNFTSNCSKCFKPVIIEKNL